MDKVQNFNKGLNSDVSPIYQPEGSYVDALNMEIISDEIQGSFAISNSKGNKFQVSIPDVGAIYKMSVTNSNPGGNTFITINGTTNPIPFNSTGKSAVDLYNYLIGYTPYGYAILFNTFYSATSIVIIPIAPTVLTISTSVSTFISNPNPAYIPASSNLKCIGYGVIRDDIYLFTTNSDDVDPQTNGGGYGYIWKFNYNNITFNAADTTISLIYAGDLAFSTYWNIPQTGIIGRYENSTIQRLYWTDNYNRLRSLNVADPQLGALDISLVDVVPSIDFDIPLMQNINSAAGTTPLKIGCYQLAYKLSNTGGSSSTYSVPSNPIFVVNAAEELQNGGSNWKDYHGDVIGTTTTKRITWKINSLDRDFNRIEAVLLVRESKNDVPTIYSVYEGPIQTDSISISIDGDIIASDNTTIVTIDEYLTLSAVFTHAKTIGTKDNRLVVGNVRNEQSDIVYDARTYRFRGTNIFDLIDTKASGLLSTYVTPTGYNSVPAKSDAIAPYNLEISDPLYNANGKFKEDGVTIGGSGTNISYEFYSVATAADKTVEPDNPQPLPIVSTNPDYITSSLNLNVYSADKNGNDILQQYPLAFPAGINDGMKYPQMNSMLWGYQNNEIYRFGIQFYDKSKNPYFVKWIGDIKFPDYFDTCVATNNTYEDGSPTGLTDFRKSFTSADSGVNAYGANDAYCTQLGIKFTVNIPTSLAAQVGGYSIVRVQRNEADKRVVAEGIISNTLTNDGGPATNYHLPIGDLDYNAAGSDKRYVSFLTPNVLDASLLIPTNGMKVRVSSYLSPANATQDINIIGGDTGNHNKILKLYRQTTVTPFESNITFGTLQGLNTSLIQTGNTYFNITGSYSNGNPAYLLLLTTPISNAISGTNKFFAYIYNAIIDQYGGDTYTDRGNNEYIMCSHFRPIKSKLTGYIDTFKLYGGDTTNDIMDEERISRNWTSSISFGDSTTLFYPGSSPVNRELRHGRHANTDLKDVVNLNNERTDYFYNTAYSCINNIIKFDPAPDPFIDITTYDNRFYISEIKINGELADSWSMFKANNYWDVEGDKGPINSMVQLRDKMYFWQDRAFGIIEINPRAVVTDTNSSTNAELQVGTGLPLQRHDYVSTIIGTKHQGSTINSSDKLYWFDVNTKKIYAFSADEGETPVSDIKGLYSYLNKNLVGEIQNIDKPTYSSTVNGINGVSATYDNKRNKAIFTFHSGISGETIEQTSFTIVLNERLSAFTTFHSFVPNIYINDYKHFFSSNNTFILGLSDIYIHDMGPYGEYYGVKYDSYIKFVVNPNPQYNKIFDNLVYDSQSVTQSILTKDYINHNDDTWNYIRITDDYQNTDKLPLIIGSSIERKERSWKLDVPRNRVLYTTSNSPDIYTDLSPVEKTYGERMRDKYIQIELWYSNALDSELRTNNLISSFRQSPR